MRHAYLLTGPAGVGRRTLALRFAQALNCPQPAASGVPCRSCRTCRLLENSQHPDLAVVQAEQVEGTLKVDQVRELQRSLALSPYEAKYRIALLLRFEEAHPSAANALLKTLEEPPPKVILLLTAESPERLLPTIVSRCEVLRLRPMSPADLTAGLQAGRGLSEEQARLLAHLSAGRPGFALRMHREPEDLERRRSLLDEHLRLLSANRAERFAFAWTLSKDREKLRFALQVWLSLWRDILLVSCGSAAPLTNLDREDEIRSIAARTSLELAETCLAHLEQTRELLDRNANARLATEVLMLDLPRY
jgi:DNA polymerase III subunit delta'